MKIQGTEGFGYKTADVSGTPAAPAGAFITPGMPELGAAGLKIGHEIAQGEAQDAQLASQVQRGERIEAETQAKVLAREAKRAEAMTVHARAQNALGDAHDQLAAGIQNGTVPVDQAPKAWAETSAKIVDDHLKTVDRSNVELVRAGLEGNVGTFGRSLSKTVETKNRQTVGAGLADYLEEMQRLAVRDPETAKKQGTMAIDAQGPLAGYNPQQVQKLRQDFIEMSTFNNASARLNAARDDAGALRKFVDELPEAKDLDPGKKNILESRAMSMATMLDNKAAAAEGRRITQLKIVGDRLEMRISMGVPIPDHELLAYQQNARGTVFEGFATGLADEQKAVATLLKKTPAEQGAFVADMEQKLMTSGEGNPKVVAKLKQTVAQTIKLVNDNPVQYAMDRGGAVIEPLDVSKPDSWAENLAHRTDVVRAQYQQVGGGRGVLMPQEAATLGRVLDSGTPETQKAYLEPLRRAINDDAIFRSTVQQFAKDAPTVALAANIMTKEAPLTQGVFWKSTFDNGDTASLMLEGRRLLNPSRNEKSQDGKRAEKIMPSGADGKAMNGRFADTVGEVYAGAPEAYDLALQGAREVYAGILARKGNFSGEFDSRSWAEAISRTSSIGKYNGSPLALPWGMDEATFKNKVANAFPAALKDAGLPPEVAQATGRFRLQNLTGNTYVVRQGTEDLIGPRGKVVIQVPEVPGPFRDTAGRRVSMQVPQ